GADPQLGSDPVLGRGTFSSPRQTFFPATRKVSIASQLQIPGSSNPQFDELDERIAAGDDVRDVHVLLSRVQAGAAGTEQNRRNPGMTENGGVGPEACAGNLRRHACARG